MEILIAKLRQLEDIQKEKASIIIYFMGSWEKEPRAGEFSTFFRHHKRVNLET